MNAQTAAGVGVILLYGGAEALALFNLPELDGAQEVKSAEPFRDLQGMSPLEQLAKLPRRHVITYQDTVARSEIFLATGSCTWPRRPIR